jgi:hypothetical protein
MRRAMWLLLICSAVAAADEDDSAALALTAAPVTQVAGSRPLSLTVEAAATAAAQSIGGEENVERLSVDERFDGAFAHDWRAVVAARVDTQWLDRFDSVQEVGTLKEAYVSWQPQSNLLLDAGRINGRQGVALGYNPTDFFRADAIRSLVSPDPNSLRDNRLGTVMLRGQQLWDTGALTAVYAPRLADNPNAAPLDPDLGATNSKNRWLLSFSQQLGAGWSPQWLLYGADGQSPQAGVNLTSVIGQSMVAYVEAAAGRSPSLLSRALNQTQGESFRSRASTGFTYSTANKLSLTLEYEYNGAGSGVTNWNALRFGNLYRYARYREYVFAQQDLPTRSNLFVYASWQDLIIQHLDLSAFFREDLQDHSRFPWLELRHHWTAVDLALRWQDAFGGFTSDLGAQAQRQTWQFVVDYYL